MQVWAAETSFLGHKASTETTQVQIYSTPNLLATGPCLWEKPNPNVSCSDGLVGGRASIWYPDSQFKEKLSVREGVTPKTFSDMLNTPKLCWDTSVWVLIFSLLLCHPWRVYSQCGSAVRGALIPLQGKGSRCGENPIVLQASPNSSCWNLPSLHISALSCCCKGSKMGQKRKSPPKLRIPPGSLAAQVGHGVEIVLPMGLANRVLLHIFFP